VNIISMGFKWRKFRIWLISLGVVLVVYIVYTQLSETPRIKIDTTTELPSVAVIDSNSELGKIGGVGVETVQKARYTHLNEQKQVDRELGFERVLHKQGNEWDIEKPYMNVFRRKFKCYLTADKGKVQVESAVGRPSPKDATFTDNVIIRILPEDSNNVKESFIYLDDVTFISEKTQFSTPGPVKFISEDAKMLGKGVELIYNDQVDRLELLRITHLKSLRFKILSTTVLLPSGQTDVKAQLPVESTIGNVTEKKKTMPATDQQGQSYKCILSENVVIETPEQLVFTDELTINNIFWPKSSDEEAVKTDATAPTDEKPANVPAQPKEPNEPPEQFVDIVVTCDNGVLMVPMDSSRTLEDFAKPGTESNVVGYKNSESFGSIHGQKKYTLSAPKVTADLRSAGASTADLEHLTATGGVVQLSTVKKKGEEILGFTKLKAHKFDFIPDQQLFLATGPGIIAVDNSRTPEPNENEATFSLNRPCWAVIENFDTLKFFLATSKLTADAGPDGVLNINYFPVVEGQVQYDRQAVATAAHVQANLTETVDGQFELSTLNATGGITYEQADIQFAGSELFYDYNKHIITVQGDKLQPCLLNGALVDGIEYNVKTGELKKGKIAGPGALQIK